LNFHPAGESSIEQELALSPDLMPLSSAQPVDLGGYHVLAFFATNSKAFLKQLLLSLHKRRHKG
jgi:hypothetical protein